MKWSLKNEWSALRYAIGQYVSIRRSDTYLHWRYREIPRLRSFKNKHFGEGCFILGNGPSLNKIDLRVLNDYNTFGLNKIYLMFARSDFRPKYYVSVNRHVIEQSKREINHIACPVFLSAHASYGLVPDLPHIFRIMTNGGFGFQGNLTKAICEGHTVTFVAMQIAYYMGFQKVFLVGVDHNFNATGKPNEEQLMRGSDSNHFDPKYFKNMLWQLPDLEASEAAYRMAYYMFKRDGRDIYDATIDGKLTVFPKLSFDDALKYCKRIPNEKD